MKANHYLLKAVAIAAVALTFPSCDRSVKEIQAEKAAAVIHANDELFNKGNVDYADQIFAADYSGGGPAIVKKFVAARLAAFPDLEVKVDPVISDGKMTAWLRTNTGTQRGGYAGYEPTNKKVTWKEMVFTRYNDDGQIAEEWAVSDMRERLSAATGIDGHYRYVLPLQGEGVNHNGRFVYLVGDADNKGQMRSHSGTQLMSGDTIKNYIEFSTDPKQVGTMYMWRITSWSGDTASYETMDASGKVTGSGKAVRISH